MTKENYIIIILICGTCAKVMPRFSNFLNKWEAYILDLYHITTTLMISLYWLLVGMEFSGTKPKTCLSKYAFQRTTRFSEQNPFISVLFLFSFYSLSFSLSPETRNNINLFGLVFGLKFNFKHFYQNCGHFVLFPGAITIMNMTKVIWV